MLLQRKIGKDDFDEWVDAWKSGDDYDGQLDQYELKKGHKPEVYGTYIHPDLVHYIAQWVGKVYAERVRKIMNELNKQVHTIMEDNDLPDVPVVAKKLLDSAEVKLKVKDDEIQLSKTERDTIKEEKEELEDDYEKLEDEFDELAQEKFDLEKKHIKTVRKVKKLERQQYDRDVRTDFCSRKVKILKDVENNYYLSSDDSRRYRKYKLVRVYEFVSGINMRLDIRNWMAERFNRKMEAVPEFSKEELPVVEAYLESKNPKRIIVYE
jgi:hypothetical protein